MLQVCLYMLNISKQKHFAVETLTNTSCTIHKEKRFWRIPTSVKYDENTDII